MYSGHCPGERRKCLKKLNHVVTPWANWWVDLGMGRNASANGLPGIEILMPAGKEVKPVLIQQIPQFRMGIVRSGVFAGVLPCDMVTGRMNFERSLAD